MPPQQRYFSLPHIRLAALQWGKLTPVPVVALHGWLDNAASFVPLARYFDYPFVALEMAGHGHSDHRPAGSYYHFVDFVHDLTLLIEQQGWQKVILLGHSMGGMIASLYAAVFPEKVHSLLLIESLGLVTTDVEETATQLRRGIEQRCLWRDGTTDFVLCHAINARAKAGKLPPDCARLLIERGVAPLDKGRYRWRSDKRLRQPSLYRFCPPQAAQLLRAIMAPVLCIYAEDGYDMVKQAIDEYRHCYADLTLRRLAGGHHLHMTAPQAVADSLNCYLSDQLG